MRERKGSVKIRNRDVAVGGSVRESEASAEFGKSYLFCLTSCPPCKRLSRRLGPAAGIAPHVAWCRCIPAALEKPEDRVPLTPGRTQNRIRSPSYEPVDCWRTARAANAARAARRVSAGGRTGNSSLGSFFGRRTANSELCSECQSEEIQPRAGFRRDETTAKGSGLAESAGKEDPVELDSSPTLKVTTGITGLWQPSVHSGVAFDPSMSALPIIVKQNSPSVGLFTHQ
ncbi:hypothetical protein Bca101_058346 [Brassica carinata]